MPDQEYQHDVICPHCGEGYSEGDQALFADGVREDGDEDEVVCRCGKTFTVVAHFSMWYEVKDDA